VPTKGDPSTGILLAPDLVLSRSINAAVLAGALLPKWRWAMLGPYNGATGEERIAGWQQLRLAELLGWLDRRTRCSLCGGSKRIHHHSENYFRPLHVRALCQACHFCLHRRFRAPEAWLMLVAEQTAPDHWACRISLTELSRETSLALAQQFDPWWPDNSSG
jgi:hypothetical protein